MARYSSEMKTGSSSEYRPSREETPIQGRLKSQTRVAELVPTLRVEMPSPTLRVVFRPTRAQRRYSGRSPDRAGGQTGLEAEPELRKCRRGASKTASPRRAWERGAQRKRCGSGMTQSMGTRLRHNPLNTVQPWNNHAFSRLSVVCQPERHYDRALLTWTDRRDAEAGVGK